MKQKFISDQPFHCIGGGVIPQLELVYETYGELSVAKDNVILIHHALSTDSHLAATAEDPHQGWWELMVGPGRAIDTDHYYVICINNLGSCFGSSGPMSQDPATGDTYRLRFPAVTIADMVHAQQLLLQSLKLYHLHAVIGPSMGGMLSLAYAMLYPHHVKKMILISSSYKIYPANDAVHSIQRDIIRLDPAWQQGNYQQDDLPGFELARKFGHLSYRNRDELNQRFATATEHRDIHSYLDHNAKKFTARFDANSYLYLTAAMDCFDITRDMTDPFAAIQADCLIISVNTDCLFLPEQQQDLFDAMVAAGNTVELIHFESDYGHDAFLVEIDGMGEMIKQYL